MRPDEIVVGGVYQMRAWRFPRKVVSMNPGVVQHNKVCGNGDVSRYIYTVTSLNDFASWAKERIDGEGK